LASLTHEPPDAEPTVCGEAVIHAAKVKAIPTLFAIVTPLQATASGVVSCDIVGTTLNKDVVSTPRKRTMVHEIPKFLEDGTSPHVVAKDTVRDCPLSPELQTIYPKYAVETLLISSKQPVGHVGYPAPELGPLGVEVPE